MINRIDASYKAIPPQYNALGDNTPRLFYSLIWGIDEVCSFTHYSRGTIYNLVSRGEIPFCKRGRKRRLVFIPSDVISWFKGE
ncbi:MAG: helix-turn-helix domain-containing protein [Bdellovibrio sp.]|nr:helix-turn-helix domain-containing protein [Bdellovibrio sp.]